MLHIGAGEVTVDEDGGTDLDPSAARILGRWRWGEPPPGPIAPPQAARQLAALAGAAVPQTLAGTAATSVLRLLDDAPRDAYLVRDASGATVATLVHWPHWHFVAIAPGQSLASHPGAIFLPVATDTATAATEGGLRFRAADRPELFVPLALSPVP